MSKYVGLKIGKVHEEHTISEYYCGGCGWPVTDHDSYCPECGGALNQHDADSSDAENAKLRELVRDMWNAYHDGATNREFRALPDRMRELGVDGCE